MFDPLLLHDALGVPLWGPSGLLQKASRLLTFREDTSRCSGKFIEVELETACCPSPVTSQLVALVKSQSLLGPYVLISQMSGEDEGDLYSPFLPPWSGITEGASTLVSDPVVL